MQRIVAKPGFYTAHFTRRSHRPPHLAWYRSASREKRTLICAIMLCNRIEDLRETWNGRGTDFQLSPKRFMEPEAAERLEELEYVKIHARVLAKEFWEAVSRVEDIPSDKVPGFAYTAALSDAEHEKLLKDAANFAHKETARRKTSESKE